MKTTIKDTYIVLSFDNNTEHNMMYEKHFKNKHWALSQITDIDGRVDYEIIIFKEHFIIDRLEEMFAEMSH